MSLRIPTPHGRPWSGAFNVVMATAIVSIAARQAGLHTISDVLLVLALLAFGPLAALDAARLRHPVTMLHRAGQPGRAFPALGFVADAAVLGSRIMTAGGRWRAVATILLIVGAIVWFATEGLAILLARVSSTLHWLSVALWALGGALYVMVMALLARRLWRGRIRPHEFTPDWWIVMGAPAIFAVAAATLDRSGLSSPIGVLGLAGWAIATVWIPVLAGRRAVARPDPDTSR